MTQTDSILQYMRDYGSVTPLDALREFGCMRLAARIDDLKKAGHRIVSEWAESTNRYGQPVRYKCYRLARPAEQTLMEGMA